MLNLTINLHTIFVMYAGCSLSVTNKQMPKIVTYADCSLSVTNKKFHNITNVNDAQDSWSNNKSVIHHIFTRKIYNTETHLVFLP